MTIEEFKMLKEKIESAYRDDMAALERVWKLMNGSTPPDGLVDFEPARIPMRSAEALGIPPASQIDHSVGARGKRGGMTDEEKKERKKEYMRRYWAKRAKAGKDDLKTIPKKKFSKLLLKHPLEANGSDA